jgi:ubiquinone/menaquinone biosynthesis C-methylase UbiE
MLRAARERAAAAGWENIDFVQGDAARLDQSEASLGGALCTLALSAMPEHEAAIQSVHTALAPGRRFAVLDAKPLEGPARLLNPLIRRLFRRTTNWGPDKDVIGSLHTTFGELELHTLIFGAAYVAVGKR